MQKKSIMFTVFAFLVSACGQTQTPGSAPKHILGSDDRVSIDQSEYPFSAVGRIKVTFPGGSSSYCTASLVDQDVALTAAHCLYNNGVAASEIEFLAQYSYGQFTDQAKVIRRKVGSNKPTTAWAKDWALLKLDKDLGSSLGWLGIYGLAAKDMVFPWTVDLPGYSSDAAAGENLSAHLGCRLTAYQSPSDSSLPLSRRGTLSHNCDLQTGASGAPLITMYDGFAYVLAIQSYHFTESNGTRGNGAVATDEVLAQFGTL